MLRAGKICGIMATLLLLFQLLLTSRLAMINRFLALDSMASWHKYNGMVIVTLLTAHALLILVPEGLDNLPIGLEFWPELVGVALYFSLLGLTLLSLLRDRIRIPIISGFLFTGSWDLSRCFLPLPIFVLSANPLKPVLLK